MKFSLILDEKREEEVVIYAHEKNELVKQIEDLVANFGNTLTGYKNKEGSRLCFSEIFCFTTEGNKVYALTGKEKFQIKVPLYKIEKELNNSFVRINQSCIANIKKIAKFDTSVSGTMKVIFKNGYIDYVSRRNLKNVKERLGIKHE